MRLHTVIKTADERVAVAELAWKYKLPHRAVRIARIADRYGQNLGRYAYPTSLLPRYKKVVRGVEKSLVYGLIRQESEFDITARSRVGAQGLMQIMPATAKAIARDHKQKYNKARLTREPAYNLTLGTAHIHDLLAEFDGSYIMMIAAYNAGASRPRKWMERYGDPRKGEIDPIDWVETIPFTETRNYVQKVLQNVQVYRSIFYRQGNCGPYGRSAPGFGDPSRPGVGLRGAEQQEIHRNPDCVQLMKSRAPACPLSLWHQPLLPCADRLLSAIKGITADDAKIGTDA